MFSNINTLRILIPKFFYNRSEFLSYIFKHFAIKNVFYINTTYPIFKIIYEFSFFLVILDNGLFPVLNDFFLNNNTYQ